MFIEFPGLIGLWCSNINNISVVSWQKLEYPVYDVTEKRGRQMIVFFEDM
jgi:hypothetical protein